MESGMLTIDGFQGEGGGQVLRSPRLLHALSLIRARRFQVEILLQLLDNLLGLPGLKLPDQLGLLEHQERQAEHADVGKGCSRPALAKKLHAEPNDFFTLPSHWTL